MIDFLIFITKRSAFIRFLMKSGGGGGMLNLVYGSSSSSYMDCVVNFVDECLLIDDLGFVAPVLASSSLDVPSAVHHAVRMSYRRLYVIIFVSLIEFMIMFMICVARSYFGGRRRLLHHVRDHARQPIRLVHSLLFFLLPLVSPPPRVVRYQLLDPYILCGLLHIICLFFSQSVLIICSLYYNDCSWVL